MKAIIDGKTYNTATATEICQLGNVNMVGARDHAHWSATLYKTKKGNFFMEGEGGAASAFARPIGNVWSGGDGIVPLSPDRALSLLEQEEEIELIEEHLADYIAEA